MLGKEVVGFLDMAVKDEPQLYRTKAMEGVSSNAPIRVRFEVLQ